jgi:hypothetical protein
MPPPVELGKELVEIIVRLEDVTREFVHRGGRLDALAPDLFLELREVRVGLGFVDIDLAHARTPFELLVHRAQLGHSAQ